MTITDHLEFSVLSAPLAALDRRSLSQAWYSALYAQESQPVKSAAPKTGASSPRIAPARADAPQNAVQRRAAAPVTAKVAAHSRSARVIPPAGERRAPTSSLARKIETTFARSRVPVKQAAFALEGGNGRVQILLRQAGPRVRLVALCPPSAHSRVLAALAQARYALAARGVSLDAQTRGAE